MADAAASIAVDPIYAPSPDMAALLQRLGFAPQTGAAATAAQPPPASAAVTAAPQLVRPQASVVQAPATPQQPVSPQMARTQVPTISLPHDPYGLAPASSDPAVVDPMLDQIYSRESGFNGHNFAQANIRNLEGSDASGIAQIRPATWNEFNWGYKQYKEAIDAPENVQRIVAARIFAARGEAPWLASNPTYKRLHGGAGDPANTNLQVSALSPDVAALLQSLQANDAAATKAITEGQNQRSELINKMLAERPPVLSGIDHAFAAPPPTPDVQPLKTFQNFGVALALLGSLLTRRPLTSALKSGAAAMDAYNKGQYRDYAIQRQNWLDNVDLAMKQNQLELDKYRAAQDAYQNDMNRMQYAFEEIAANNHDTIALQQLKNGQIEEFIQLLQHREDMTQRYELANMRYRLGGGPLTRAQAAHDDEIFKAQDDLQSLYGIDWQDPKALANIYNTVNQNGGFVDLRTRDILTKWKLAHETPYEAMNSLPGLGRGQTTPADTGGDLPPWPSQYASDEDGHIRTSPDGKHWMRKGDKAIEVDENGKPIEANMAPAIPATPVTVPSADSGWSKWWPGNW